MFEAFRLARPVGGAAAARSAGQGPPRAAAASPAEQQGPPAKRRRGQPPATSGSGAAAAAAAPPQAPSPAGGLALEKMGDAPLRLVIVGHNPSEHAWASSHFYSNPTNWFWRILRDTGIAPPAAISGAADDGKMPAVAGVGFTDVGSGAPGTDSSQFTAQDFEAWRPAFYQRMATQARRASAAIGCTCGACGAPCIVAFSGKRQFQELFAGAAGGGRGRSKGAAVAQAAPAAAGAAGPPLGEGAVAAAAAPQQQQQQRAPTLQARRPRRVDTGRQWVLPEGWPLPLDTEVWVMTSTSGAAPMTRQQRLAPWQALAERLRQEPWPRRCVVRCRGGGNAGA
ncbi:hypothetical protein CHLNCDRAFT_134530 [Chlorella variabilis]|uniref:Uracil-DNA glycosylase-like domain-containing protein n=1 Tax=Chlorella variabilis TaxID=554065 RepID=E1ZG59_CHLVA|nr:hypothetical protein CHLNCDRAFT_134530 [Chlorella variabilis]EFN55236.1 hypothetical protein CHLNCDRAFT_134530 [Chlorella variabilis]|eukprot:XP_005847338.1 hypothetical protein CHLNCDRAFT_134530 [Chlorella variabilis]